MRIGFLITYFYPQTGGAENNCYYLAKELAKKHEVHVFCSGKEDSEEKISGIRVHRSKEIFRFRYYMGFYPGIIDKLLKYDLDVLHLHGFGFIQHDIAVKKIKQVKPNTKIVCTPHGPFMALDKYNPVASLLKKMYMPIIKKSLKQYDAIIEVNPYQDDWIVRDYGVAKNKIKFVPNGITNELFSKVNREEVKKVEKKYNLGGKFILSYLGRIQKYKGLDQVIRILPELKKINKDVLFIGIGKNADDLDRLNKLASELKVGDNVLFTGQVDEKEKLALLDLSEIFVFPSEWEAFGIGMLEAMARGNAAVSSKTEGGKYLIKDGVNGFLFDYKNEKELFDKLKKIVENTKLREKMQKENVNKSKEFLWSKIVDKLEAVYNKLV